MYIYTLTPAYKHRMINNRLKVSISYAYKEAIDNLGEKEALLIQKLREVNMLYYKSECVFRGYPAYRIIVYGKDVVLDGVLGLLAS